MELKAQEQENFFSLAIIGSGPAGLTAAIYAARAELKPVVLAGVEFGGQLMNTTVVENYPGFSEGINGPDLMQQMIKQAQRFNAEFVYEYVRSVNFGRHPFQLMTDTQKFYADSVIVAVGSSPRRLGIPTEEKFWGRGVSTCATCDGALYKDKVIAVVGGGDSAMEEATFLTRFARKVYLIHRRNGFRASKIMQDRLRSNNKIEIVWNTEVVEVLGEQSVSGLKLVNNQTRQETVLNLNGVFLAIGHVPQTDFLVNQLDLDDRGYISTPDGIATSVPGVFVAGDVADPTYQQAVTAAGMGCKAAMEAEKFLVQN